MILEKKTRKEKIIEVKKGEYIPPEERGKNPFPEAKRKDTLYFKIRESDTQDVPLCELIIKISKKSIKTLRVNFKKRRMEIMKYLFKDYLYWTLGDFCDNIKPIQTISLEKYLK